MKNIIIGNIIVGKNSLVDFIDESNYERYGLVISRQVYDALNLDKKLASVLKNRNHQILLEVETETNKQHIDSSIDGVRDYQPDIIIAVGGGSVIDAAKLLWLFYELPDTKWEDATNFYSLPRFENKCDLVAVPTTSGTGSENTGCAMFVDENNQKGMFLEHCILPTHNILDVTLLETLPKRPLIYSAFDALTHAIEAITNTVSDPVTKFIGIQAILSIFSNLEKAVKGDLDAREELLVAANFAGVAINNANTGLSHTLNYPGETFNLPHGLITGMITPYWIYEVGEHKIFEELNSYLGIEPQGNSTSNELFASHLVELFEKVDMPYNLAQIQIDENEYQSHISDYVDRFAQDYSVSEFKLDKTQSQNIFTNMLNGDIFREKV